MELKEATVLAHGKRFFPRTTWTIHRGEHWAIVGPNGSGNPAGASVPTTSSLNYAAGQTRGNNAVAGLSSTADLAIYCAQASGTAHVIVDVTGYFE